MPLKYSCFISYARTSSDYAERIVDQFCRALREELELWMNEPLYVDTERLQAGDLFEEAIAHAICESVSMIVLFTPTYFDQDRPRFAREYLAMETIERRRLGVLGLSPGTGHDLIIPIALRGGRYAPPPIKSRRFYSFEQYLLGSGRWFQTVRVRQQLSSIAEYIAARRDDLANITAPESNCTSFRLPSAEETRTWLARTGAADRVAPFPLREVR